VIQINLNTNPLLTLADVILTVGPDDNPLVDINVGRNSNIKSLHITDIEVRSPFTEGSHKDAEELRWLNHFLSDVGESCRPERIKLEINCHHIDRNQDPIYDWSSWEGVDRILVGTNFKSLREVSIEVFKMSGSGRYFEACENLARRFPLLRAGGVSVDVD
jgi:hypothetical protein